MNPPSDPLICPECKKAITPHEITLFPTTEDSFFMLEPTAAGHCERCGHIWEIHDRFFLLPNNSIVVERCN